MYIGAATQNVDRVRITAGIFEAAVRTESIIQAAMSTSASCKMYRHPPRRAAFSAIGPYAATQTGASTYAPTGNCSIGAL